MQQTFFDWANIGGGTIFLKTTRNEKIFELGQKNILFYLFYELFILANTSFFPKFDPLTAPGMDLCVDLGPKCQN